MTGSPVPAAGHVANLSGSLYCIVQDESGNYWPYRATPAPDGRWTANPGIGPAQINRQLPFTLILAGATAEAADWIRARYSNVDGVGGRLPVGVQELSRIQISRVA